MNKKTRASLRETALLLRSCARDHGIASFAQVFHDAEDVPEFDVDPEANYLTGLLQGAADVLGLSPFALLRELEVSLDFGSDVVA